MVPFSDVASPVLSGFFLLQMAIGVVASYLPSGEEALSRYLSPSLLEEGKKATVGICGLFEFEFNRLSQRTRGLVCRRSVRWADRGEGYSLLQYF